ncbi:MAG: Holliday junction branch migration protein RuvA [Pseudomonadota bacterium]
MIGKLTGIIDTINTDHLILDVNGVGYIIYCSSKALSSASSVGSKASFLTNMQVKEDDISLYGFINRNEQEWFDNLIKVQGIGPRLALVILSALDPVDLVQVIMSRQKEAFKTISGVGPKLAERIFIELGKKAGLCSFSIPVESLSNTNNINDAVTALSSLGYGRNEAYNICKKISSNNSELTINELIRLSLKDLSS